MKLVLLCSLIPLSLCANPIGPEVVQGDAAFSTIGQQMEIKAGDQAIIHWRDFSIQKGELTRFIQPNIHSVVINKVIEANPSHIFGTLEANGKVYLINPNGILVGKEGEIHVGSWVASTLEMHFGKGGDVHFSGSSKAPIINLGRIEAFGGEVLLIGSVVENHGTIDAKDAALLAGREVIVKPDGLNHLYFQTTLSSDDNPYASVFDHEALPDSFETTAINSGHIKAEAVHILGKQIELIENSSIDASGERSGGQILVGGDFQGKNPSIENAKEVFVAKDVLLDVSATLNGNAGKIIVFSDQNAAFHGTAFAKGGPLGGDGGFVEISGKTGFKYDGKVSTLAPMGKTGTLLFDPNDITIQALNPTDGGFSNPYDGSGFPNAQLLNSDLTGALAASNVIVQTSASTAGGNGDIFVNAPVIWNPIIGTSLTLSAQRNLNINAKIVTTGAFAGDQIRLFADSNNIGNGSLNIDSVDIKAAGGGIIMEANNIAIHSSLLGIGTEISGTGANGSINATARNDIEIISGNLGMNSPIMMRCDTAMNISAGHNILIKSGKSNDGFVELTCRKGPQTILAGNNIDIEGSIPNTVGGNGYVLIVSNGQQQLVAGEDLIANANHPIDTSGSSGQYSIMIGNGDPSSTTTVIGMRDVLLNNGPSYDNAIVFTTSNIFGQTATFDSIEIKAAGDIVLGSTIDRKGVFSNVNPVLTNTITVLANHLFSPGEAWSANPNPRLSGTPLAMQSGASSQSGKMGGDGLGSFAIRKGYDMPGSMNPAGVEFITVNGAITVMAASKFRNGTPADFLIANFNNLVFGPSGILPLQLETTQGNLAVDYFNNITIDNKTSTAGNFEIIANNNMTLLSTADLLTKNIALVVDNQDPIAPLIGPGQFTMAAGASIAASGGYLRIFTARRSQNTISGSLNGGAFVPGPLYVNSPSEQWNSYYNIFFNGMPYTVFYKDSSTSPTPVPPSDTNIPPIPILISQLLTDLHPSNEFVNWPEEFTPWAPGFRVIYEKAAESSAMKWASTVSSFDLLAKEQYWIQYRKFQTIHQPHVNRED